MGIGSYVMADKHKLKLLTSQKQVTITSKLQEKNKIEQDCKQSNMYSTCNIVYLIFSIKSNKVVLPVRNIMHVTRRRKKATHKYYSSFFFQTFSRQNIFLVFNLPQTLIFNGCTGCINSQLFGSDILIIRNVKVPITGVLDVLYTYVEHYIA